MGKDRDALGSVLSEVRLRLARGEIRPGQGLSISDLAQTLRTSTTPVREALATLTGEGVLVSLRRAGFMRLALTANVLSDLYSLHHCHVDWAIRGQGSGVAPASLSNAGASTGAADLFAAVVARADNAALSRAYGLTVQMLAPAFRAEPRVLTGVAAELGALAELIAGGSRAGLLVAVDAFHRRRLAATAAIHAALAADG